MRWQAFGLQQQLQERNLEMQRQATQWNAAQDAANSLSGSGVTDPTTLAIMRSQALSGSLTPTMIPDYLSRSRQNTADLNAANALPKATGWGSLDPASQAGGVADVTAGRRLEADAMSGALKAQYGANAATAYPSGSAATGQDPSMIAATQGSLAAGGSPTTIADAAKTSAGVNAANAIDAYLKSTSASLSLPNYYTTLAAAAALANPDQAARIAAGGEALATPSTSDPAMNNYLRGLWGVASGGQLLPPTNPPSLGYLPTVQTQQVAQAGATSAVENATRPRSREDTAGGAVFDFSGAPLSVQVLGPRDTAPAPAPGQIVVLPRAPDPGVVAATPRAPTTGTELGKTDCAQKADAQGLHGKTRRRFLREYKRGS
jgi:hypothetical protein